MYALVVYESMFGSTHELAEAIVSGLSGTNSTERVEAEAVRADRVQQLRTTDIELLVAGGPTHAHTMSTPASRHDAVTWSEDPAKNLDIDAPPMEAGLREWFDALSPAPPLFAAFDTRTAIPRLLAGAASVRIGKELRKRGSTPVVPPESFLVTKFAGLVPGELERGRAWGESVAAAALRVRSQKSSA
jgi:hypothetical protein